ncbi:MAG TPA: Rrf2 family transcriptional regulator [Ktedonobacterales bacterium]|nr:Rrf2 family transcriptional regulator [Ktedonobacterales bacterium]
MRMTMKNDYGLRAMIELASRYGQGAVPSSEIARHQVIPEHFLDQLLITLRRGGLLKSQRGPQGGHSLARSPAQITMSDVINALDGSSPTMECVTEPKACQLVPGCAIREVWRQIDAYAQQLLSSVTLEQLALRHRSLTRDADHETMYYI